MGGGGRGRTGKRNWKRYKEGKGIRKKEGGKEKEREGEGRGKD